MENIGEQQDMSHLHPEVQKQLDRVLTKLGARWTFFCQMMASQVMLVTEAIPTMATDGSRVMMHPKFFLESLNDDTRIGVMAHELVHVCLEHVYRRGLRHPTIWNCAIDFKTNQILCEEGFVLPSPFRTFDQIASPGFGALRDTRFDDMSEEQVYNYLMDNLPPQGEGDDEGGDGNEGEASGNGRGKKRVRTGGRPRPDMEDIMDPSGTAQEQEQQREKTRVAVISAAIIEKQVFGGQGKGFADRMAKMLTRPKERWFDRLRRFVSQITFHSYNWQRINRRELFKTGIIMPEMRDEVLENIVVAVDLSGSITDHTVDYFTSHMNKILDDCRPQKLTVMYFDDGVDTVREYSPEDFPVTFAARGGGGTDFRPVFDAIDELDAPPTVLIFLTDTYGAFPNDAPAYPVIWASIVERVSVPFGEFVYIDESEG